MSDLNRDLLRVRARARTGSLLTCLASLSLGSLAFSYAPAAHAGGIYFSDRGVRPLARGGAFVAGAGDAGAIWYNPAGLADAGTSFLMDGSWLAYRSEYTRQTLVRQNDTGAGFKYTYPTVSGSTPFLPLPTFAGTIAFGDEKQFTLGFGVFAPYAALSSYPLTVNNQPSGSRYSLGSLDGSILVTSGLYFAYKPIEEIRIGIGIEALVGNFDTSVVFSASPPKNLIGSSEDPAYDAASQLKVGPIFSPSGNGGVTLVPEEHVRIGLAGQLPFIVNAPAKVQVKLPNAEVFNNASQDGDTARLRMELPAVFRAGIEYRTDPRHPRQGGRIELAYVREFWTTHHSIDITPEHLSLLNVTGFPSPYNVSPISLPRNFDNSNSIRLGGEYTAKILGNSNTFRIGISYDTSAIPVNYVTPLTIDSNKVMLGLGSSLNVGDHLRLEWCYAHYFVSTVTVDPNTAAVPKINPVKGNTPDPNDLISANGGTYKVNADLIGLGLNYKW